MTPILVPQIVRNSLQQLQDTIWPVSPTAPRPNARESLDGCFFVADMLLRSWDYLRKLLTSGMERSQAVSEVKEILESIDRSSATFVKVRQLIKEAPSRSGITPEDLIRLDDQERKIEALRHQADAMLRSIERPLPPLDPADADFVACKEDRPVSIKMGQQKPLTLLDPDAELLASFEP